MRLSILCSLTVILLSACGASSSKCSTNGDCGAPATCGGGGSAGKCGCPDEDHDGHSCDDCDDHDATVYPGAPEICDNKDNNCDGQVDEGMLVQTFYADGDHDGFGNPDESLTGCFPPSGFVTESGDCNDADPAINPGRPEVCDYKDNDCDGVVDNGVSNTYYRDADGDGFGDPKNSVSGCTAPSGYVADKTDCDDSRADTHPGALEICNSRDDDCDGTIDGDTRACDNACGPGIETCTDGIFAGCTAPPITAITTNTLISASAHYACLQVKTSAKLSVAADAVLQMDNWVRVEAGGTLELGARDEIDATGDIVFAGTAILNAIDATLASQGTVSLDGDSKWVIEIALGTSYSGGGSAACTDGTAQGVGGGGGGARGGSGAKGGTCGTLHTQAMPGAGGSSAADGASGCNCDCSTNAAGGAPSGGAGGVQLSGGGGGGGGGVGGNGAGGSVNGTTSTAGAGGLADTAINVEPVARH